ncbi:nuclear transport factor 2 family protein [Niabella sp.]|uniref:nuclear transport factor 2 family protein n=1 Tax=Niabella sp. TaxID=1962976 RepID=UPI002633F135|nr:nuclear transport factor 2 family protein [Niabella sp.]
MAIQILDLEKKYWQAMEAHDYDIVKSLTRFPCIIAGKNGVRSVDEASFKEMFDSGAGAKIKVAGISGAETQPIGENGAVIAYQIELRTMDDEQKPSVKCACASTWIKENGNWVCALHTESELARENG